jgi:hypothetical protein
MENGNYTVVMYQPEPPLQRHHIHMHSACALLVFFGPISIPDFYYQNS